MSRGGVEPRPIVLPWTAAVAGWSVDIAAGNALLAVVLGWRSGVPGAGPTSVAAAAWASFARAAVLWSVALTAAALGLSLIAVLASRRELARALPAAVALLAVQVVLASALFTPWGGINLQQGGGDQQAMVAALGGLGAAVLAWFPAPMLRGASLLLAVALPVSARRPSVWASLLLGSGAGLLLTVPLLETAGLGGSLFAPSGQLVAAAVVGACLAAAGVAANLRASRLGSAGD